MMRKFLLTLLLALAALPAPAVAQTNTVTSLPSIAAMQALGPASRFYTTVNVQNYTASTVGGGGVFYWDSTSTATANVCTVFQATGVGTGRWLRQVINGGISVLDCGAVPGVAIDQAAAFQAANDAAPTDGWLISLGCGDYRLATTWTISKSNTVAGCGYSEDSGNGSATILTKAASLSGDLIHVTGNAARLTNFGVEGIAGNGGDGIHIAANGVSADYLSVNNQGRDGLVVGNGDGTGNMNGVRLDTIIAHGNDRDNIHIDYGAASTNANAGTLTNYNLVGSGRDGLHINGAGGWVIAGGFIETAGRYCSYMGPDSSQNVYIGGDWNETCTTENVYIDTGAEQNQIFGTAFASSVITDLGVETVIQNAHIPGTKTTRSYANSVATGTTVMPYDDTIPQVGEGDQYMSVAVERQLSDESTFTFTVVAQVASAKVGGDTISCALFSPASASAIGAASVTTTAAGQQGTVTFVTPFTAPTGTTTFTVRCGGTTTDGVTFNGSAGARKFGGVSASSISVVEGT